MTTILFVSEGPTDIGPKDNGLSFEREKLENESNHGVICGLVKKIIAEETGKYPDDLEAETIPLVRLHRDQKKYSNESIRGLSQKVKYVIQRVADKNSKYYGCTAIVFVVDQDNQPDRIKDMVEGREKARNLQDLKKVRIALGVAIKKLETWLLADTEAICKGLKIDKAGKYHDIEEIESKKKIRELFREDDERSTLEKFMAIVESIENIKVVVDKCPKGFAPFYEEIKREVVPLFH